MPLSLSQEAKLTVETRREQEAAAAERAQRQPEIAAQILESSKELPQTLAQAVERFKTLVRTALELDDLAAEGTSFELAVLKNVDLGPAGVEQFLQGNPAESLAAKESGEFLPFLSSQNGTLTLTHGKHTLVCLIDPRVSADLQRVIFAVRVVDENTISRTFVVESVLDGTFKEALRDTFLKVLVKAEEEKGE